jgi:hypothetical protein
MGIGHIIGNFSQTATTLADQPGVRVPTLTSAYYERAVPAACADCAKSAATHPVCERIAVATPFGHKLYQQEIITQTNAVNEKMRRFQSLLCLADRTAHGQDDSTQWTTFPASSSFWFDLVSASGNSVILRRAAGDSHPNSVAYTEMIETPGWYPGMLDENNEPVPHYVYVTRACGLPAKGVMKLSDNSRLTCHGGWIVRAIHAAASLPEGYGTFEVELDTPIGGLATSLVPGESGPIRACISVYLLLAEQTFPIRDTLPQWCVPGQTVIMNPQPQVYDLTSTKRIRPHEEGTDWVRVFKQAGGVWEQLPWGHLVSVIHVSDYYRTRLNLVGQNLAGIEALRVEYFIGDPNSLMAINAGQNRCASEFIDYTDSYGTLDSSVGHKVACGRRSELLAKPEWAGFAAAWHVQCTQTTCPFYAIDKPTHAYSQQLLQSLALSLPWKVTYYWDPDPEASIPPTMERNGTPSLTSLAGHAAECEPSFHGDLVSSVSYGRGTGGWPQMRTVTIEGTPQALGVHGGWFLTANAAGSYGTDLANPETWPEYGPLGNLFTKLLDYDGQAISDESDPHRLVRAQLDTGTLGLHKFDGVVASHAALRQRFVTARAWFPRLAAGGDVQPCVDGTAQRGAWTAGLVYQATPDASTVYGLRLVMKPFRHDRTQDLYYGGATVSVTVKSASYDAGELRLFLKHKSDTVTRNGAEQSEVTVAFNCAGGNVQLPEFAAGGNYSSSRARIGRDKLAYVCAGQKLVFSDAAFAGHAVYGRGFHVTWAKAASDPAHTDPFKPGWVSGDNDAAWFAANVGPCPRLSPGLASWGTWCDEIRVRDENGALLDWLAGHGGVAALAGKSMTANWDVAALPDAAQFYSTGPETAGDTAIAAGDCLFFSADGELFVKSGAVPAAGDCVYGLLKLADRTSLPLAAELSAYLRAFEKILGG